MENNAGQINRTWYNNALANGTLEDIQEWFSAATNSICLVSGDLCVWSGYKWLTQAQIDHACKTIDGERK